MRAEAAADERPAWHPIAIKAAPRVRGLMQNMVTGDPFEIPTPQLPKPGLPKPPKV